MDFHAIRRGNFNLLLLSSAVLTSLAKPIMKDEAQHHLSAVREQFVVIIIIIIIIIIGIIIGIIIIIKVIVIVGRIVK